ncbi:unnamed protein product [Rotaria magnacalcarata]|uniref:Uncharacterized protein n=1 Tax=Rotaria magnacalcarata TaxID=392030 RepID=A0A816LI93_9BILA|nr:unnamed protein product [Rotaria magnacalcarata]
MSTTPTVLTILSKSKSKTSILCFKTEQQCPIQNVTVYHDRAEVTRLLEYHFDVEGKPHRVTIGVLDFNSKLIYTIIPKLSIHAYLNVSTINTSGEQLVVGSAVIFMDNNFLTHSSIGNICMGGKFDLPLGPDAGIKVDYQPTRKIIDTQGIVCVYDQIPRSLVEKIKVKLVVPDLRMKEPIPSYYVTLNDANSLYWKCIIQAGSECQLPLEYTLE